MSPDPIKIALVSSGRNWVDYFAAFLTPMIPIVAAWIGWQHAKTNRNRLKNELFDRRYAQFEAITEFLRSVAAEGRPTREAQREFLGRTAGLRFTYDQSIRDYVHENIWCKAIDLETLESELAAVPVGPKRSNKVERQREIKLQLHRELKALEQTFGKFLELRH